MAGESVLGRLAKAGPVVAERPSELRPLRLELENRKRLVALAGDLADASLTKRLRPRWTADRRAGASHRRSITHPLAALHQEINEHRDRQATPPDR